MAVNAAHILYQLQRWTAVPGGDSSDAVLLERFTHHHEEAAFAALVARHGAMVLRLCRRILGDVHAAEDTFQAVFLILARKAGSLKRPDALPAWLYGVARRVALKARTQLVARSAAAAPLHDVFLDPRPDPLTQVTARELLDLLDAEVQRLPPAQRSPFVLCCLEGRTQEEAARILGTSPGAIKGRLERGRQRLHVRLRRHGIALSAALALVVVTRNEAAPILLRQSAVRAALGGATGSPAMLLADSVLKGMAFGKLAGITAVMVALVLSASAAALIHRAPAAKPAEENTPPTSRNAEAGRPEKRVDRFGDPLHEGALLRLGTVRWRAGASINHAALSPDGKLLATASESGITLFDLASGKPRPLRDSGVPNEFDRLGSPLAFSPDGKQLVNITTGGNLRFWDVATGTRLRIVGDADEPGIAQRGGKAVPVIPPVAGQRFNKVWFTPGSANVIESSTTHLTRLIDPSTGKTRRFFSLDGELASVSSDGKNLAVIDGEHSEVILYDDYGKKLRRFRHQGKLAPVQLCQDGKRLVTVNDKAEIKIWDTTSGKEQRTIAGLAAKDQARTPTVVAVAPDGNGLFLGTQRGDILRWDLRTGKEQSPLRGHAGWVTGLFPTPDGRSLISVSWDNLIHRWNLATGKAEPSGEGYIRHVRVARAPDGQGIAAASHPGRLEFWDARTAKPLRVFSLPAGIFSQLRYSPDGKLLALASSDARVRLWDVKNERVVREINLSSIRRPGDDGRSWFEGLAWSPDGRLLAASLDGDGIRMWEAASGKELWHAARKGTVAFSPDGKTLVSGSWDRCLTFQDAATGTVRFTRQESKNNIIDAIAFSPDDRWLATCHHGGNVYLRDPKTGDVRKTLPAHREVAWSLSFSPDSKWLASSGGQTVCVWEVATGAELLRRKGHEGRAYQAEFGADGCTVLSSSLDLTALLWSIRPSAEPGRKRSLEALWADLAGEPAAAYRALWELTDEPKAASDLLRKQIAPLKIDASEKRVQALLTELDSDDFGKRESATRALKTLAPAVEGRLRRTVAETKSAEVQHRLRGILDSLKCEPTTEDFRRMRAVQVMELCGTAEARGVLRDWASGTAGLPLTEEAKAALERWARREKK